jgi:hypothetical protein
VNKKKQKNFLTLGLWLWRHRAQARRNRSFLLLFFKKEALGLPLVFGCKNDDLEASGPYRS